MKYDVTIDKELFSVYPEIRLGLLRFHADVKAPDERFWDYMNAEVLPQVRSCVEGKEWSEIPGIKGSRSAYKAFGGGVFVSDGTFNMSGGVIRGNQEETRAAIEFHLKL